MSNPPLIEVGKRYLLHVNKDDDKKWRLPSWVDDHNRLALNQFMFIEPPFQVRVQSVSQTGIWVQLYVLNETYPRSGIMQIMWRDILVIEDDY